MEKGLKKVYETFKQQKHNKILFKRTIKMSEKIFNKPEYSTIISMGIYWEEVSERKVKEEILYREYVRLANYVKPEKLLGAILKIANDEANDEANDG